MEQPTQPERKHRIAVLALDGFVPFDLSTPYNIFAMARRPDGKKPYELFFSGPKTSARNGDLTITRIAPLNRLNEADTVIIPGIHDALAYCEEDVFTALRSAATSGVRLASICTGACILAAAGLLHGLRATTHWELLPAVQSAYPSIAFERDVLFVDNGRILTSAGLASGIDLCLHMIRKDYGAATAADSAEFFVVPVERGGGHAQRIQRTPPQSGDNLSALQFWLLENLHLPLAIKNIAKQAFMSERTLNRKFREQTGMAPMVWLSKARIRRAQALLEGNTLSIEQIASAVGFGSPAAFRATFQRYVGVSPMAWRKTYAHYGKYTQPFA